MTQAREAMRYATGYDVPSRRARLPGSAGHLEGCARRDADAAAQDERPPPMTDAAGGGTGQDTAGPTGRRCTRVAGRTHALHRASAVSPATAGATRARRTAGRRCQTSGEGPAVQRLHPLGWRHP